MTGSQEPFVVDLTNCDREPIHVPGAIQPHGVLFALAEPELTVVQASDNVPHHLGLDVAEVLGQALGNVLEGVSLEKLRTALADDGAEDLNPLRV
ncbi:MAG TPA: hypothetical protein VK524_02905, partial [Polyangiaceae bacterium]|nr:hypothetical protein [Polyangiaceae bacterium]